jgi:anaerobic magnesium-protoporphyrin IX monomethyl ester cyclase
MKNICVFLINPPAVEGEDFIREGRCMQSTSSWVTIWPPLTLAILAAITRKYAEVQLLDCIAEKINIQSLLQILDSFHPDIIILSAAFPSIEGDNQTADEIKNKFPKSVILGFGLFFTLLEKESLGYCKSFDAAIIGEPELTYEEFLQRYVEDQQIPHISGLVWKQNGNIEIGPKRQFIEDLDRLPYPARDLLKNELYVLPNTGETFTLVNSARGCFHPCIFCISPLYYGKKIRRHSIEYILEEVESCRRDFNIHNFLFWEEVFTSDKQFCMKLCDEFIRRNLNIKWAATTRADSLDLELLVKMKESNCVLLGLGIESGSERILKNAKKNESMEQVSRAVSLCKKVGIPIMGHFIFGLPGEDDKTIKETINYALKLGLDYIQCYSAVPYPKTELGEMAKSNGWLISDSWSDYDFGGRCIINRDNLSHKNVDRAREKAFRRFYFRLSYLLKQIKNLKSPRRILHALNFVKWIKTSK